MADPAITFDCNGRRREHPQERFDNSCEQNCSQSGSPTVDAPSPSDSTGVSGLYEEADQEAELVDGFVSVSSILVDSLFSYVQQKNDFILCSVDVCPTPKSLMHGPQTQMRAAIAMTPTAMMRASSCLSFLQMMIPHPLQVRMMIHQ